MKVNQRFTRLFVDPVEPLVHLSSIGDASFLVDEISICPRCYSGIRPVLISSVAFAADSGDSASCDCAAALFRCPVCHRPFMVEYSLPSGYPARLGPVDPPRPSIPDPVPTISPMFMSVYRQALEAHNRGLDDLSGLGLRRALEFLVKDFLIFKHPEAADSIRASSLSQCIQNYVSDESLKTIASRAAWIGNDFAHYIRLQAQFNFDDLKRFISAVVAWIVMDDVAQSARSIVRP